MLSRLQLISHSLNHHPTTEHIDKPAHPLVAEHVSNLHAEPLHRPRGKNGCLIPAERLAPIGDGCKPIPGAFIRMSLQRASPDPNRLPVNTYQATAWRREIPAAVWTI